MSDVSSVKPLCHKSNTLPEPECVVPKLRPNNISSIGDLQPTGSKRTRPTTTITPWKVIDQRLLIDRDPWLKLYEQRIAPPSGKTVHDFHYMNLPDHVVVYARTRDNMVATLKQYKHGLGAVTNVLPGGMVEPEENPYLAAQRELLEETGLASGRWYLLGKFRLNGNLGCGDGYYYLADSCYFVAPTNSGDLEEAELEWFSAKNLHCLLHSGAQPLMHHALAIALVRSFETES
jgi:8-oxo-dGTP pyrophosphatase MutT (NUDIX family)